MRSYVLSFSFSCYIAGSITDFETTVTEFYENLHAFL
jgi:hypothetical protein